MQKLKDHSLYFVTGEEYSGSKTTKEVVLDAILGGVDIVQMREKKKSKNELLALGQKLKEICQINNVLFIVNDDPFLTKELNADGVHLGQQDIEKYPIEQARAILGNERIIGVSTHSIEQFQNAQNQDCDYLAFGPIFYTKTKDYFIGLNDVKNVLEVARKPVVFIGGINLENIDCLLEEGARNIAVIRCIAASEDVVKSTKELKNKIMRKAKR
ncbi:MAG: thiamine phosphate synthase [Candidatus Omnitrophica bacterium]|nr:thiamine phosphate synthase [Candidatus Omnitrophota bacterium]